MDDDLVLSRRNDLAFAIIPISPVPHSSAVAVITVASICLSLAWISLALRLLTRKLIIRSLGWDDATMAIATVFFSVFCGGLMKISVLVDGRDQLEWKHMAEAVNYLIVTEVFYVITLIPLKISLGIFFLRIMVRPWQRKTIYATVVLSVIVGVMLFFDIIFQCGYPRNAEVFFKRKFYGHCTSKAHTLGLTYTHEIITFITDLIFALLPITLLRKTFMPRREKITVGFVLTLGTIGGIASAVRLKYLDSITNVSLDFFSKAELLGIWSTLEPGLGITAGCLATLRPLLRHLSQVTVSSVIRTNNSLPLSERDRVVSSSYTNQKALESYGDDERVLTS